ncbi:MAG: hypothetical protein NT062_24590 [Proteobacteria bacterium]|nr:hypothetical protein [Pseudomonadota bacterium]
MRLGTCIALELAVAVGAVGGLVIGVSRVSTVAGTYVAEREAAAATAPVVTPIRAPSTLPEATLAVAIPTPKPTNVFGASDRELLAPIVGEVVRVKPNRGGTSLSLRIDFASGARASFKPEQTHPQSDPRREIAAYRIDRMLEIGHVPPSKSMAFTVDALVAATDPRLRAYVAGRLEDEGAARQGILHGEVSWWIPEIKDARIGAFSLDEPDGMRLWESYLQPLAKPPAELADYLAQVATVVVFDVLIDNADRWSGSNTKVSPDRRVLYFMDNSLAFSPFTVGHEMNLRPMRAMGVFPKQLVARLRALDYDALVAALAGPDEGELGPLLTPIEIRAILARRDHVLAHVDELIATYGEAAVLALP